MPTSLCIPVAAQPRAQSQALSCLCVSQQPAAVQFLSSLPRAALLPGLGGWQRNSRMYTQERRRRKMSWRIVPSFHGSLIFNSFLFWVPTRADFSSTNRNRCVQTQVYACTHTVQRKAVSTDHHAAASSSPASVPSHDSPLF